MTRERVVVSVSMPEALREQLRAAAQREDRSVGSIIRRAVRAVLDEGAEH